MKPGIDSLMSVIDTVLHDSGRCSIALVGAGGKTSTLFALARAYAARGLRVLAATTTRMFDPECVSHREGKGFAPLVEAKSQSPENLMRRLAGPETSILLCSERKNGKLLGIAPALFDAAARFFDVAFVEADGARGLSLKAPGEHEPVMPSDCAVVIGVVGLDALGKALDAGIAHRPELLSKLVGCPVGSIIEAPHIARLASSPLGLFKASPEGARRVVLLNKTDATDQETILACLEALRPVQGLAAAVCGATGKEENT